MPANIETNATATRARPISPTPVALPRVNRMIDRGTPPFWLSR